ARAFRQNLRAGNFQLLRAIHFFQRHSLGGYFIMGVFARAEIALFRVELFSRHGVFLRVRDGCFDSPNSVPRCPRIQTHLVGGQVGLIL
ncbi:MAG: hypothetical protein FWG44_01020, partial [Oscillospiraceae bacterium]|nr:hypothetical protein [Oscillospiraceae bacterium]